MSRVEPEDVGAELEWLRRENRLLRVENEMLTRIATEYALDRQNSGWPGPEPDRLCD